MEVHIVVKGDTLWKIARQYGIPFEELKRVNAHLANPDYIVPGMKIFLPNKVHGGKQEHVKHPEKGKVPVTPAQPTHQKPAHPAQPTHQKPAHPAKPTHQKPAQPTLPKPAHPAKPTHQKPAQPTQPKPTHPKPAHPKPTPPIPVPPPAPVPAPAPPPAPAPMLPVPMPPAPMPPAQAYPMPPFIQHVHPMIGIPCGWMPIFDADCYPFMHSGQIQAMPRPQAPESPMAMPMAFPSTQFPMYEEECEESPIFSSQGPATLPLPPQSPMVEGWKMIESPEFMFEESPEMDLQPSAWCPPEQGYIPQTMSPAMQQGYPMMPFPAYHQGCGCGCDGHQHHQHQHPMMMMPLFYGHPCNCQSSMQPMPYQMMPTPYQGSNWYGSY